MEGSHITLQLTVGQSVRQGIESTLELFYFFYLFNQQSEFTIITFDQILISVRRLFSQNFCLVAVGRPL
jgi:hypothetical protein